MFIAILENRSCISFFLVFWDLTSCKGTPSNHFYLRSSFITEFFQNHWGNRVGPETLWGFRLSKSFWTPEVDNSMSGIAGKKISPLSGIGPPGFWVNTELNWLLRMVALSGASEKLSPS